jgi:hypothetical protein
MNDHVTCREHSMPPRATFVHHKGAWNRSRCRILLGKGFLCHRIQCYNGPFISSFHALVVHNGLLPSSAVCASPSATSIDILIQAQCHPNGNQRPPERDKLPQNRYQRLLKRDRVDRGKTRQIPQQDLRRPRNLNVRVEIVALNNTKTTNILNPQAGLPDS